MAGVRSAGVPDSAAPLVRVTEVTKIYRSGAVTVKAVDSVSLDITAGQCVGLVGETGSGKSTLGRVILGLEDPTSGYVEVDGRDLAALSARGLRRLRATMAIVMQDPVASLNRRKTVAQIVGTYLRVHRIGTRAERRKRTREVLEHVGLDPQIGNRRPLSLSGGQNQRVNIARALAVKPRLVVLDEAVSALDVSLRAVILNLLHSLQAELGLTYLFISHDLAVVRYMCDEIAVMYQGRIVEHANRHELFSAPRHPYTHALLDAIPRIESGKHDGRLRIDEARQDLAAGGCPARSYCAVGRNRSTCAAAVPPLVLAAPGHELACHFPDELTGYFAHGGVGQRPVGEPAEPSPAAPSTLGGG